MELNICRKNNKFLNKVKTNKQLLFNLVYRNC